MTKTALWVLALLCAGTVQAGWESWLKEDVYRASFETYTKGQELSDIGAFNGTWGSPAVPTGAEAKAAATPGAGQNIECATGGTSLFFTPYSTGERPMKSLTAVLRLNAYPDELPDLSDSKARAAIAMHAPNDDSDARFVGWTADGWKYLQSETLKPIHGQWYAVMMKFSRLDGVVYVQYRLKLEEDDTYAILSDADGVTTFPAGEGYSDELVSKAEFRGDGAFRSVSGSEPRRGLLVSLVPWREMLIDESVYRRGSGSWTNVFDYASETWLSCPTDEDGAYYFDIPDDESYAGFVPQKTQASGVMITEFAVRFMAPNDNDAAPTNDVCALVRVIEEPPAEVDVTKVNFGANYRFACLIGDRWYTNTTLVADVASDYTVEVSLDTKASTVDYRIKKGVGAEAASYQPLLQQGPAAVAIGDPLFTFFGGVGKVYSIKSSDQATN